MNREAWQATVYGVAKSWIQLSDRTYTHILSLLLYQTHTPPLGSRGPLSSPTSPPYPSQLPQVSPVVYFRHFWSVLRYSGHTCTYYRLQSRWDLAIQDRLSLSPWPLPWPQYGQFHHSFTLLGVTGCVIIISLHSICFRVAMGPNILYRWDLFNSLCPALCKAHSKCLINAWELNQVTDDLSFHNRHSFLPTEPW